MRPRGGALLIAHERGLLCERERVLLDGRVELARHEGLVAVHLGPPRGGAEDGPRLRPARHEETRVHRRVRVGLDAVEPAAVGLHEGGVAAGAHDVWVERVVVARGDLERRAWR